MGEALQPQAQAGDPHALLERIISVGDLAQLTPAERNAFYLKVCESLGLNPYTRPFDYLRLKDRDGTKLTLYARKDCADQLRKIHNVSIKLVTGRDGDVFRSKATAKLPDGREDEDIGSVFVKGLGGEFLCNAEMKAVTKSKRRVTLSICGLGFLDETEVESIDGALSGEPSTEDQQRQLNNLAEELRKLGITDQQLREAMYRELKVQKRADLTEDQASKLIAFFNDWLSDIPEHE
jgi:hypothetical protein